MKAAIIILSDPKSGSEEALGRVFNGLAAAYDFKQKEDEVTVRFQGAGTRWIAELGKSEHPAHDDIFDLIKTPIHGLKDEEFEKLNGMQPLGRVGEVKDIVDAVLYLADAQFVTGVVLPVDGGVSAGGQ